MCHLQAKRRPIRTLLLKYQPMSKTSQPMGVRFHYQLPAVVTAVTPRNGGVSGGTIVHIYGRNFHDSDSLFLLHLAGTLPPLWRRVGVPTRHAMQLRGSSV